MKRVRLIIKGRVQMVFFRHSTLTEARKNPEIKGWVRNKRDGSVEAVIQGPDEKVDKLVTWCHHGPESARVDSVNIVEEEVKKDESQFRILPTI